ncbi:MAG: c-type cytochrome domain-containing protein, partial [Gemmataceae bacterium]
MPTPLARRLAACFPFLTLGFVLLGVGSTHVPVVAADPVADEYAKTVRPLMAKYCFECHQGNTAEADLDLNRFTTHADVKKATKAWQKVGDMIDGGQMPPKDAK